MNYYLISNLITCLCALIGFIYGIAEFFKPKKAVYAQMITLAVGCVVFGRLYQMVRLITAGDISNEFQLGILGVIGSLLFLFSANYGAMDSLADDGSKSFAKYRLIAMTAPAAAAAIYVVFILICDFPLLIKAEAGVIAAFAALASYFNLKHLIFPDVDYGVINCLKAYNLLALIFDFLCIAETVAVSYNNELAVLIIGIITGAVLIAITPTVKRGIMKWTA